MLKLIQNHQQCLLNDQFTQIDPQMHKYFIQYFFQKKNLKICFSSKFSKTHKFCFYENSSLFSKPPLKQNDFSIQYFLRENQKNQQLQSKVDKSRMNEEVQGIIKAQFCPKQKWVADKDVNNCFKCDQNFHPIFRRKHHCRYCGQIFCNTCSEYFFQGKHLSEGETKVRMCNACYQKCWKYIAKHDGPYISFRRSNDGGSDGGGGFPDTMQQFQYTRSTSFTEEDKLIQIRQVINEYSSKQLAGLQVLQEDANTKFTILLQVFLKQKRIPLKYLSTILNICLQVVKKSPPNALVTNNMDICRNIRFKCWQAQQFSMEIQSVVLLKRNYASKKIKDSYENINCIIVYGSLGSADLVGGGGEKQASFEDIVNNRTKQMGKLISYCQRLQINIIFLQGSIQRQCQDKFLAANITVIPKNKIEHLNKLKVALQIELIVESVHELYSYTREEIVGTITSMNSVQYPSIKKPGEMSKFYAVKSVKDELGMVVMIRGQEKQIMQTIKKQLGWVIMLLRHLRLKVHKVLLDQTLLNSMSELARNDCYLRNPQMFFNFYNEHHSDILTYLRERYLSFKHITYTGSDYENYPEVSKPILDQYLKNRRHAFRSKWDYFTEICGEIRDYHKIFYSDDDNPIGVYLLKKLTSIDTKCSTCKRPNYHHIDVFYSTDHFVKVWTESRILADPTDKQKQSQQFVLEDVSETELLFSQLARNTEKRKIVCYIECEKCQEILSDKIKLTREHLQYSMIAFLNHFFKGTTETFIRQGNEKKAGWSKQSACNHGDKIRVFQMGDKSVKIYVGSYTVNRLCLLTQTGRQSFLNKKEAQYCLQFCIFQVNKIEQIVMYMMDEIKGIAQTTKNSKFDKMLKDPKSSFISARRSIIGNSNVKLSQAQCVDMILPELIDQLSKLNTISGLLLNPKKINKYLECQRVFFVLATLLKKSFFILTELKKSIKKRELEMKFEVKDFETDFLMEEIDINSLADSSSVSDFNETENETNKEDMMSSTIDMDKSNMIENYDWLQPFQDGPAPHRSDRKTVYNRRNTKATQEQVTKMFKEISSALRVEHSFFEYVPTFPQRPQSLIASALNCQTHKECITSSSFSNELMIPMNKLLESQLKIQNQEIRKLENVIQVHERMFDIGNRVKKGVNTMNCQITFLFPNQFEILRRKNKIPLELFIQSVAGAESWMASGGKSGSPFMRSFNDLIVIKKVTVKQFMAFKRFLPKYFSHLHQGSMLVPIYGAFVITKNSTSDYYIAMENLFFGMKDWYLYDFKGSITKRFSRPPVIPLDVNYLVDRHSEPIFCKENVLKNLGSSLDYLVENNIVDYSLILVVEIENQQDYYMDGNRFHLGIVDYLREFGPGERVQRIFKGQEATVQQPVDYQERMYKNLKKYFTQIPL